MNFSSKNGATHSATPHHLAGPSLKARSQFKEFAKMAVWITGIIIGTVAFRAVQQSDVPPNVPAAQQNPLN